MVQLVSLSHPEFIKDVPRPNYKFLGLSLSTTSLDNFFVIKWLKTTEHKFTCLSKKEVDDDILELDKNNYRVSQKNALLSL